MAIGTLGAIVFEASADRIRTFRDASHHTAGRWAKHEVIGQPPKQEFIGRELRILSLAIKLDSSLGVDPEAEIAAIRDAAEAGTVLPLMLGGVPCGSWVCKEAQETWTRVASSGRITAMDVMLSLEEYA